MSRIPAEGFLDPTGLEGRIEARKLDWIEAPGKLFVMVDQGPEVLRSGQDEAHRPDLVLKQGFQGADDGSQLLRRLMPDQVLCLVKMQKQRFPRLRCCLTMDQMICADLSR